VTGLSPQYIYHQRRRRKKEERLSHSWIIPVPLDAPALLEPGTHLRQRYIYPIEN
jgi:hypothetical protein